MEKKKFESPNLTAEELSAELVVTNLKLTKAHEQLLKEEKIRNEMFSSISHDLRSPITAIKNAVELLSDMQEYPPDQVKPLLQLINSRVDTLEQLINDIFFLVSLDNQCVQMDMQTISLGFFLEDFFYSRELDTYYNARNLQLAVPEDLDVMVTVDPHKLTRVLDNLLSNARKYSHDGDRITLGADKTDDTVTVYVEDTGIGIATEYLSRVFERCFTVEKARTPGISSTGLGLSITKSIIEQFSGKIWCESTLGKGSRFSFTLPISSQETITK